MVMRSFAAGKSIIPARAKRASGSTSVCSRRSSIASRSSCVPGTAAAMGAKALTPPVTLRSANMPNDTAPNTSRIVQMNDVGPSTATEATPTTTSPPLDQFETVTTRATTTATSAMTICADRRRSRGTTASASTPTHAAAKTTMNGSRSA